MMSSGQQTQTWRADLSSQSRDIDDMPAASLTHAREDAADYICCAKEVYFELFAEVPVADFFERAHEGYC